MSDFLDKINSPSDVKALSNSELNELAGEIRAFLVENVTKTGGHLASNLGVVETTLALLKVFDMPNDKIVWDVGHQAYVYKLLTGRKGGFESLRQFGGMSGFPKTTESEYDSFNTGHSSTSASAAIGMARARDLQGEKNNVIALFGDGALTGGMIFEAMNDAGRSKTKVVYILNDNEMAISENVGAISKYLRNLRQNPKYFKSKEAVLEVLSKIRGGAKISAYIRKIKRMIKASVLPTTLFEDMGFDYYGPIDGHNIDSLCTAFEHAKSNKKSVFIHILTKKGKGYLPAESNPQAFHGIAANNTQKKKDFSAEFGEKLLSLATANQKIVAVTGAMPTGTGLAEFEKKLPKRYFDVGIAEQHAVTMAAGMAISGMIPVVPLYSTFLQRAYDQALHDVCLQNLHVVFPVDRAGVVGADGETHQGMYDISMLYAMPNTVILSPSKFSELDEMLEFAINEYNGPVAIRYPRGTELTDFEAPKFRFGKGYVAEEGNDVVIFTTGRMIKTAYEIRQLCKDCGVSVEIAVLPTIKPLDKKFILDRIKDKKLVISLEDGTIYGGMGSAIAMLLCEAENKKLMVMAYPDKPIVHGKVDELDRLFGLDAETIADKIKEKLNER